MTTRASCVVVQRTQKQDINETVAARKPTVHNVGTVVGFEFVGYWDQLAVWELFTSCLLPTKYAFITELLKELLE